MGGNVLRSWGGLPRMAVGSVIGALSFEGLKSSFEAFLGRAKDVREMSEQLEMSTDQTQKWQKAVDRLGLSFGGLQNVIETLNQKRIEAFKDPTARAQFTALGIDAQTILNTKGVDSSEFTKRVLQAGGKNEFMRKALADLIGRRGVKYTGAAGLVDSMQADMPKGAIDEAFRAEQGQKKFFKALARPWTFLMSAIRRNPYAPKENFPDENAPAIPTPSAPAPMADPMADVLKEKHFDFLEKQEEAEKRLRDVQRQGMTIEQRRLSIQKEMVPLRQKIKLLQSMELNDAGKLKLIELQTEMQGYQNELDNEKKKPPILPFQMSATAMDKVGLYGASSASYFGGGANSGYAGIQMAANDHLEEIKDHLRVMKNEAQKNKF